MKSTDRLKSRGIATLSRRPTDRSWFEEACAHEDADRLHEAMRCYRRSLEVEGRTATTCFNLGNVLYGLRRKIEAVDFFRQSLERDPQSHEAWNNLGIVLCELRQCDEARRALQQAIALAPWFADAVFNLADCLDERGQRTEAIPYWENYLRLDAAGAWADYARSRLDNS